MLHEIRQPHGISDIDSCVTSALNKTATCTCYMKLDSHMMGTPNWTVTWLVYQSRVTWLEHQIRCSTTSMAGTPNKTDTWLVHQIRQSHGWYTK